MAFTTQARGGLEEALQALRQGRPVLVADDPGRENEGDVVLAAQAASPEWIAWTIRYSSGVLCAPLTAERADALDLPPMVSRNEDPRGTAYTVSVDAREGVHTGISAADRALTLRLLADDATRRDDLVRPGHVFPLRARPGGVLERAGHTEAAVDLCSLAGLAPVGVIAEAVEDDGAMMRLPALTELGRRFSLPVITIEDIVRHRRGDLAVPATPEPARVTREAEAEVVTSFGTMRIFGYRDLLTGAEHMAVMSGTPGPEALVRVHSECVTGEAFHSLRCECAPQLHAALQRVAKEGGVVVYLRGHEGRGIGLVRKIAAYHLQNQGMDTVQANLELGEAADSREYGAAAAILTDLQLRTVRLLTNNPAKVADLEAGGVTVAQRLPLLVGVGPHNDAYMRAKRDVMGHAIPALVGDVAPCA